ncbi:MAG: ParA family protein [Oscillospiraceae bacterium]
MSLVISVVTQKGGVGKTTTVNALSSSLNKRGARVLSVDMDPQSNLSFSTGADFDTQPTVYDVMRKKIETQDAIQRRCMTDIIPSNILLSGIELEFTGKNREFLLKNSLAGVSRFYDYILIDSPPGLGILTVNALAACDYVIIPMTPDIFSLQGLQLVYETIAHIRQSINPDIKIAGILVNKYNKRSKLHCEVCATANMISQSLDIPIFGTYIRNSYSLAEAQSLQRDIHEYARKSAGAKDFCALAEEISKIDTARSNGF